MLSLLVPLISPTESPPLSRRKTGGEEGDYGVIYSQSYTLMLAWVT